MKNPILPIIICVIVAGGSFFAGMKYQQSKQPSFSGRFGDRTNTRVDQGQAQFRNGRPVQGDIINADEKTVTVKMADGSTKIIILSEATIYNKTSDASKADLKVGEKIGVFGTENADGSVTAQNIQFNPQFRVATGAGIPQPGQ